MSADTMGTELTPQQTFEQKISDRIRADIGELMPDEVLKGIVGRAMEKAFFAETVTSDRYGHRETKPPLVAEIIKELLETKVRKATLEYLHENDEKVQEMLDERLSKGLVSAVVQSFDWVFKDALVSLQDDISNRIRHGGGG